MANQTTSKMLLKPIKIGDLELKNRIVMASLTRNRNSVPDEVQAEYYTQRSSAGLIVTEAIFIVPQGGAWDAAPGIYNRAQIQGWKKVVDSVHKAGGKIVAQLWHIGRIAHPDMPLQKESGMPVYAPSAIAARSSFKFDKLPGNPGYVVPTAVEDPRILIDLYKQAAINCKEAGFDGIELHAANGFLPNQFLESLSNKRTDKYGGSFENQRRFVTETLTEMINVYGAGRVGIKISPRGGYNDMSEETVEAAVQLYGPLYQWCEENNLAYVQTTWGVMAEVIDGKPRHLPDLDIIKEFRHLLNKTAYMLNHVSSIQDAEDNLQSGNADLISFGKLYIANPDLVERIRDGHDFNTSYNFPAFYTIIDGKSSIGYTDYPRFLTAEQATKTSDTPASQAVHASA